MRLDESLLALLFCDPESSHTKKIRTNSTGQNRARHPLGLTEIALAWLGLNLPYYFPLPHTLFHTYLLNI